MSFSFPQFAGDFVEFFAICAEIKSPPEELLQWVAGQEDEFYETSYDALESKVWITAFADTKEGDNEEDNGDSSDIHFHISAALSNFFARDRANETPRNTTAEVEQFCERFIGLSPSVVLFATYKVPKSVLPDLSPANILGTKLTVGKEKVVIDKLEARFAESSSAHKAIKWQERAKDESIIVRLRSRYSGIDISEDYIPQYESIVERSLFELIVEDIGSHHEQE